MEKAQDYLRNLLVTTDPIWGAAGSYILSLNNNIALTIII